ncbi:unnamed protein product [Cylicostephanus goldi]|uniref:Uncharacterized protein n=1 Tax=Cylicostephanus goldi TaxID=71465 RepID=A0A3P6PUE0_CYLGO|nr:unnamed protein product [Cylicostephanus goldi]
MFPAVPGSKFVKAAYEEKPETETEIKDRLSPDEEAQPHIIESKDYDIEEHEKPLSSPKKVERSPSLSIEPRVPGEEDFVSSEIYPDMEEDHHKLLHGKTGEGEQHIIESEDFDKDEQRSLSSPTRMEMSSSAEVHHLGEHNEDLITTKDSQIALTGKHGVYIPQGGESDSHVIESEDFISQKERSLSPTKLGLASSALYFPETQTEDMAAIKDSPISLTEERGVYTPQAGEGDSHVIESEDFAEDEQGTLSSPTRMELPTSAALYPESHIKDMTTVRDAPITLTEVHDVYALGGEADSHVIESEDFVEQKERSLSPTRVGPPSSTEIQHPESHIEDITTTRDSSLILTGKQAVYTPQAGESQPHVTEEEEMPLSSPTRTEPQSSETDEKTKMKEPPSKLSESDRLTHVVDSADYDLAQEKRHLSSDIATDAEHPADHHSPTQPSLHVLQEEALGNVFKMRFSDTAELESPEQQSAHTPSSYPDEQHSIAGDDEWKVYDSKGEVVEEFSTQLTEELIQEAETNASVRSEQSPRKFVKQESSEVTMEPEVDYHSDLQEKLDILAEERREKLFSVQEEEDQLEVIDETDYEQEAHQDHEIEQAALRLVDEAITAAMEAHEEAKTHTSTSGSNVYQTATEHSKDEQYDTCVTSQDTYDSAQEWASQESEYTTAASGATSRLSEAEERQGSVTPLAILSPVDSDRHFTANQDFEETVPVIRHFMVDDTARSTPDVPLQVTIEEEEEESEATLPTSPSGVLLPPRVDPGRPVSPVPPTRQTDDDDDEDYFVFVEKPQDKVSSKSEAEKLLERRSTEAESTSDSHEKSYSRQLSDISSSSYADTVIHHGKGDMESVADVEDISTYEHAGSPGLAEESLKTSPEEKR